MKKILSILLVAIFILVALIGCGSGSDPATENERYPALGNDTPGTPSDITPLMWRVTSPDGQGMYLFGSIHVGDSSIYPLPDFVMNAFERSDYLAVEVDIYAFANDMAAVMRMSAMMVYTGGRTIVDDIGEELHAQLVEILTDNNTPAFLLNTMDRMRPAMWHSTIGEISVSRAGLSADYGVDMHFIHAAMARGMEVLEVESMDSQMQMMVDFSTELWTLMLQSAVHYFDESAEAILELFLAWQEGDYYAILALLESEMSDVPPHLAEEYNNAMMIQRDIEMTAVARQYMADGKDVFFVVGLAHFVGDDSIIYLLRNYGYEVELVRP